MINKIIGSPAKRVMQAGKNSFSPPTPFLFGRPPCPLRGRAAVLIYLPSSPAPFSLHLSTLSTPLFSIQS